VFTPVTFDAPQRLDRFLDLRLGRVVGDLEDDAVVLGQQRRLLGDVGGEDHVVVTRVHFLLLSH
jgi:hypothetical protein